MSADNSTVGANSDNFNHNGTICSLEDYVLSQLEFDDPRRTTYCLSRGESIGLAFTTQAGCVSLVAVLTVFVMIFRNYRKRAREVGGMRNVRLFREPADIYMLSLLTSDLIQAAGITMNMKWVHEGEVKAGHFCTVQGAVQQLGETGVAMATLAIAVYSFSAVWWRKTVHHSNLAYSVVGLIWLYVILFVFIGIGTRGNLYMIPSGPYWCWIGQKYNLVEQLMGEYVWLWLTLFVSLLCYIPLFLLFRGNIEFDATNTLSLRWVKLEAGKRRTKNERRAFSLLAYPLVYCAVILPLSIVRWITFTEQDNRVPSVATLIAITLFGLSGAFNVVLLLSVRSELLLFGSDAVGSPPSVNESTASSVYSMPTREGGVPSQDSPALAIDVEEGGWQL